jgi:hypothetical protein
LNTSGPQGIAFTDPSNSAFNAQANVTVKSASALVSLVPSATSSTYGTPLTFTVNASAPAGAPVPTGTVQLQSNGVNVGSPATVTSGKAVFSNFTSLGAGSDHLTAVYSGDSTYAAATSAASVITVSPAVLKVGVSGSMTYGSATLPAPSFFGFVNGDTPATAIAGTLAYSPAVTALTPVGLYPETPSGLTAKNYTISYVLGSIQVTPASLTVSAPAASIVYGQALSAVAPVFSGFLNGDTSSVVSGSAAFGVTGATAPYPVGTYALTVAQGTLAAKNYTFSIDPKAGSLTVTKAHLTVTARPLSRTYGAANPALSADYTITGFVNGDPSTVVSGAPVVTTAATPTSAPGTYPIAVTSGTLSAANYDFPNLANGVLTVGTEAVGDFSGVGKADPATFRRVSPTTAVWFVPNVGTLNGRGFGEGGLDVPIAADVDGDGKDDLLLYRPSTAQWFVQASSNSYTGVVLATFGTAGASDIPVPADYAGTGHVLLALYRPATGQLFINGMKTQTIPGAQAGDIPVPANYDNTGRDELGVYRPSTGQWIINGPKGVYTIGFGGASDIPMPGLYFPTPTSQAATVAVYRPTTGQFFVRTPGGGTQVYQFATGDIPIAGDYFGTGAADPAVYRPSTGKFLAVQPGQTTPVVVSGWTINTKDVPVLAPYSYRALGGISAKSLPGTTRSAPLVSGLEPPRGPLRFARTRGVNPGW